MTFHTETILNTINHTTLEALGLRNIGRDGQDVFIRENIRVTFAGDKPIVSVDDRLLDIVDLEKLKELI